VPGHAAFNQVVGSIVVGTSPVDLAVSPDGDRLVVANAGSNNVSIIDGDGNSATFHSVIGSASTGGSARTVAIAADGGRWFVGNENGYIVMNPLTHAVVASVATGTATRSTAITPDGTLLIVLTELGQLLVFDVTPGSASENQVIANASSGSAAKSVAISADGAFLFVIQEDVDAILVFSLKIPRNSAVIGPDGVGLPFALTLVNTIAAGENPSHAAFDPSGSGMLLVTNEGDQTVTVLTESPGVIEADVTITPDALAPGVSATVELSPAFPAEAVDVAGMTLSGSGSVPVLPAFTTIQDSDLDGIDELHVVFDRVQFQQVIPEGEAVLLTVSGTVGGHAFAGTDVVTSHRPVITAPADDVLAANEDFVIEWTSPVPALADVADVFWTKDEGETWSPIALGIPDVGLLSWHVPDVSAAAARILVRLYRGGAPVGSGMSEVPFMIDQFIAVRLAQFESRVEKGTVVLNWQSATESDLAGFRVLRSTGTGDAQFVSSGTIAAKGAGSNYEYRDRDARPSVPYRYRLVEVNGSGEEMVLREVTLTVRLAFALEQNVPNPFNPSTSIAFAIPENADVSLAVYDVAGRLVRTLVEGRRRAAYYEVEWDATDNRGVPVASGVYFYRLVAGKQTTTRKMVLIK